MYRVHTKGGKRMAEQGNDTQQISSLKNDTLEWIKAILIATVIVIVIRWFLFTPTIVSGISMEPNFHDKERLIVNKIIYNIRDPKRGEVIVFQAPEKLDFIKRVIGLPGDTVMVKGDEVYINDERIDEPYIKAEIDKAKSRGAFYNTSVNFRVDNDGISTATVPEGTVFVLGDNRPRSKDSRYESVGFIAMEEIKGRADLVFWPVDEFKIVDHHFIDGVTK
jgi:signal peptidase I